MMTPVDAEKEFNNILHLFMTKTVSKLEIENFLNFIKNIYKNPTTNTILNDKKHEVFPLRLGTRQDIPSPLFFKITTEGLANAIRQGNKRYMTGKRRITLSLFTNDTII